jgi:hypothetical protein
MSARKCRHALDEDDAFRLADVIADLWPTSTDPSGRKRDKARLILYCFSALMYEEGREVFAMSSDYLAGRTGMPESTVRGFFADMEEAGIMANLGIPAGWHKATRRTFSWKVPEDDDMGAKTPRESAPTSDDIGAESMGNLAPTEGEMGARFGLMGAKLGHIGAKTPGNLALGTSTVSKGTRAPSARPPKSADEEETGYSDLFPKRKPLDLFGTPGGERHGE